MKVVILGTGSTAQSVTSVLLNDRNFQIAGFTDKDNKSKGKKILGIEVVGSHKVLKDLFRKGVHGAIVAIGYDNNLREKYFYQLQEMGFEMVSAVHPSALIDPSVVIADGVVIGPGSVISPMVKIGCGSILEAGVIVGTNTQIADNVCIGIGCNIGGGCFIKRNASLAPGCTIAPFVTVGKNAVVGPGACVTKNIADKLRKIA